MTLPLLMLGGGCLLLLGAVLLLLARVLDLQRNEAADVALREREAHFRALVDWTDDMIFTLDQEGKLMAANRRMREVYGWTDAVIGRSMEAIFGPEQMRAFTRHRQAVLQTGQPQKFEWRSVYFEDAWYAVNLNPILDDEGRVRAVSGVARIITKEKKVLEEYEHLISELERFTYTVSHDLRSPLITIQGFVGILEQDIQTGKPEDVQRDMARIRQAVGQMENLLDQLLELARLGRVVLNLEPVNLGEVAAQAVAAQQPELDKRSITVSIGPGLPVVRGDPLRLREVVDNLLSNAIRFMGEAAEPQIEIGCQARGEETVCFVRDNGIGIDLRYHQKIFGLFEQLDARSEGTGVGLALVKRIIELHNGRIWVESDGPGTGSTFCFTLSKG